MELKIASYNIHKGVSAFGRRARIHDIKQALQLLDADLVFLQEVQGQHDHHAQRHAHWPEHAQHEFLAGDSHHAAYGMNAVYAHGHHGNALLSRFPIRAQQNHDVSDHAYEQRGILHSEVCWQDEIIHCYVIHLGLFAASRRRQIQALIATVKATAAPNEAVIIAGDFNDWSQSLSASLYQELGVKEAFDVDGRHGKAGFGLHKLRNWLRPHHSAHARTFPARLPWLCLDRVYLRGFDVIQAQVLAGAPWDKLSDHVPICAELRRLATSA